jgi:hypothetical protein
MCVSELHAVIELYLCAVHIFNIISIEFAVASGVIAGKCWDGLLEVVEGRLG